MKELSGKRAFVTGGGRGIGRVVALDLARQGVAVAVSSRTASEREAVAAEVAALGVTSAAVPCDVSRADDVRAAFAAARKALGGIDILVNGAGVAPSSLVAPTTDEVWHQAIETNLSGAFYCLREALPEMAERGWGRVVNVASIAGKRGAAYIGAYSASKHGLLGLTKCAALEVVERGVTVNAVCPGYVDTPMTDAGVTRMAGKTGRSEAEIRKHLEDMSPQKRLFTSEEVSALVLFLCTDGARGITGQALSLDGGMAL
jgi:NAD(P)-dependent dehydrogenase (short-subunit alcohol dehydrogenase family)